MKEKIIGVFCLLIGVLAFVDAVKSGGLNIGTWHLKPFLFPAFCIGLGWLELHGRNQPLKLWPHHSHVLSWFAIAAILTALACVLIK